MPTRKNPPVAKPSEVFAGRLRKVRERQGLTQQDLADRLEALGAKTDRATLARTEGGTRNITLDDALLYATALNVPLTTLVTGPGEAPIAIAPRRPAAPADVRAWIKGEKPLEGEDAMTYFTEGINVSERDWLLDRHPAWRALGALAGEVRHAVWNVADEHKGPLRKALTMGLERVRAEVEVLTEELEGSD